MGVPHGAQSFRASPLPQPRCPGPPKPKPRGSPLARGALEAGLQQLIVLHHAPGPSLRSFHQHIEALTGHHLLLDLLEDAHGNTENHLPPELP